MPVDIASDQMVWIADVPMVGMPDALDVYRDYDEAVIAFGVRRRRFDLDGIGQLQVALDRAVEGIRAYQDRQAAGDAQAE